MSYKDTINLPRTSFPMKANLVSKEPKLRQQWDEMHLYEQIRKARADATKYILHDGPPYANGDVHIGTALNKILKDIVVRFKTMQGFDAPYIPGWDCHGLPIEHQVMKQLGPTVRTMQKKEIRKCCEDYAHKFVEIQKKQFQNLGVLGDWDKPYLTLHPEYEAAVIDTFTTLVKKGYVYRRLKPIHWCMNCETALAEAELVYADAKSHSIYVKFPVQDSFKDLIKRQTGLTLDCLLIWTTTPWTLPANVATVLNPQFDYAIVEYQNAKTRTKETVLFAEAVVDKVMEVLGIADYKVLGKIKGKELEGRQCYIHPFQLRQGDIILADYVRLEDGTGCVHTAPGHGIEDYESGLKYNLPVISPVDAQGKFTPEAGILPGVNVFDADDKICQMLDKQGLLMKREDIVHSYPHCWRCKKPVIFRATEQWFISVDHDHTRQKVLNQVNQVKWVPDWGKTRISSMLEQRPDWCISRQRTWGVPIPVFYCAQCSKPLLDIKVLDRVKEIFGQSGATSWFEQPEDYFLPSGTKCQCGGAKFTKGNDIFDVWFESGSSFRAVVMNYQDLNFPADLYLEGTDQHRGWFQLSLLPSVMTQGIAPFKTVLTHGFVVDEAGAKVSKSKGGLLKADEVVARLGADIIRLWITSINFTDDIPVSFRIIGERSDAYRKIRNTFRYLLGNLYDFDPAQDKVNAKNLWEIDQWALHKLQRLVETTTRAYEDFDLARAYREIYNFCVVAMSSFYLDILKDRLYTFGRTSGDRRAAQTVLYQILNTLTRLIAPILVHTADEIWSLIPGKKAEPSVHLADWPKVDKALISDTLDNAWQKLIRLKTDVSREQDKLRKQGGLGNSLEAEVTLATSDPELFKFLKQYESSLSMILIISQVSIVDQPGRDGVKGQEFPDLSISIIKSPHGKCERCWNYSGSVGQDQTHPTLCQRCVSICG